jgi:DNA end-binding protein Ku
MPSIVWKGQLTFGLVSIPVKLYRAARRERVRMHYVHSPAAEPQRFAAPEPDIEEIPDDEVESAPAGRLRQVEPPEPPELPEEEPAPSPSTPVSRVRQTLVSAGDEQPLRRADLDRGYEVEPDRYVVLDRAEIKGLQRRTSQNMEIVRSVKLADIDPVFFDTSYYLVPDRGGEKPYAILYKALQATGHVALARVGMHGREHVVIVRPGKYGMLAHTMFYTDEIRFDSEFRTGVREVGAKEFELAKAFLQAIEAPFAPEEFRDVYREELQALIAKKVAQSGLSAGAPPPAAAPAPVVDILEALKKSLAMAPARKAPATETEVKSRRRKAR